MEPSDAEAVGLDTLEKLLDWTSISGTFREELMDYLGNPDLIRDVAGADKVAWVPSLGHSD